MIRTFLVDVAAGLIFLAILGALTVFLGPTLTTIVSGAALVGLLARILLDQWRVDRYNRARARLMGQHAALGFPRPIGRVSRPRPS